MTKLNSREEGLRHIKESLNFRGSAETNGLSTTDEPQSAYFSGEPKIEGEKNLHGVKAWKYQWPEEGTAYHWVTDDGTKHAEDDIDAEMELISELRKS